MADMMHRQEAIVIMEEGTEVGGVLFTMYKFVQIIQYNGTLIISTVPSFLSSTKYFFSTLYPACNFKFISFSSLFHYIQVGKVFFNKNFSSESLENQSKVLAFQTFNWIFGKFYLPVFISLRYIECYPFRLAR